MITKRSKNNAPTKKSIARDEARKAGEKFFKFICPKCEGTLFYSSTSHCVACNNAAREKAEKAPRKTKRKTQAELEKCTYLPGGWVV